MFSKQEAEKAKYGQVLQSADMMLDDGWWMARRYSAQDASAFQRLGSCESQARHSSSRASIHTESLPISASPSGFPAIVLHS
jgi:hypothetical protein